MHVFASQITASRFSRERNPMQVQRQAEACTDSYPEQVRPTPQRPRNYTETGSRQTATLFYEQRIPAFLTYCGLFIDISP